MIRQISVVAAMSLLLLLTGCKNDAESILVDTVAKMDELTAALKTVKDPASSRAAATKITAISNDMSKLTDRAKTARASASENKRLETKYMPQLDAAGKRFQDECTRVAAAPQLLTPELIASMEAVGQTAAKMQSVGRK